MTHIGPVARLPAADAERLLVELMSIPALEVRLQCVRLVRSFKPRMEALWEHAKVLGGACEVRAGGGACGLRVACAM